METVLGTHWMEGTSRGLPFNILQSEQVTQGFDDSRTTPVPLAFWALPQHFTRSMRDVLFFLILSWTLPCFSFCLLTPVILVYTCSKSLVSSSLHPPVRWTATRLTLSLLLLMSREPNSFSIPSCVLCCRPLTVLVLYVGLCLSVCLSL